MADSPDYGPLLNLLIWTLAVSCTAFLALRIWAKVRRGNQLWYDDHILIAAWVIVVEPPVRPIRPCARVVRRATAPEPVLESALPAIETPTMTTCTKAMYLSRRPRRSLRVLS